MPILTRPETMERITNKALAEAFIAEQIADIRAQVGDKRSFSPSPAALIRPSLPRFLSKPSASSSFAFT